MTLPRSVSDTTGHLGLAGVDVGRQLNRPAAQTSPPDARIPVMLVLWTLSRVIVGARAAWRGALVWASEFVRAHSRVGLGGAGYCPRLVLSGGSWGERIGSVWSLAFICR
jgi:hypothetical protein